jgi:hypothetical protein
MACWGGSLANPPGAFSWQVSSRRTGERRTAYRSLRRPNLWMSSRGTFPNTGADEGRIDKRRLEREASGHAL